MCYENMTNEEKMEFVKKIARTITGYDMKTIEEKLKNNDILIDIDEQTIIVENNGYKCYRFRVKEPQYEDIVYQMEEEARKYLKENDDLWRETVFCGNTTLGLDDWIEEVIYADGWESLLCDYDGTAYYITIDDHEVVCWRDI